MPWLILFSCLLVGLQPWVSAWLKRHQPSEEVPRRRTTLSPVTAFFATLTGTYGGYFGAGSGVLMVAVLGLGTDIDLRVVNGLKTLSVLSGNLVAGAIFVVAADLDWVAVALLAAGSVVGGYVGARVGRRLPPALFRVLVVAAGVVAAVALL